MLGVGGLAGHGHRELFFMLFGAERASGGRGRGRRAAGAYPHARATRSARGVGLALVPEDRKTEGLLLAMTVRDNLTLAILRRISPAGVLRRGRERRLARGHGRAR